VARQQQTLSHALRDILADLDEAFVRFATDTRTDERGLDCLSRARRDTQDVLEKLEQDMSMKTVIP
jgi:hypothetical protein